MPPTVGGSFSYAFIRSTGHQEAGLVSHMQGTPNYARLVTVIGDNFSESVFFCVSEDS